MTWRTQLATLVIAGCAAPPPDPSPPARPTVWVESARPSPPKRGLRPYTEADPEYWLLKLEEPQWESRAVVRLQQFFEDVVTRVNLDLRHPDVRSLIDLSVRPLTDHYVARRAALDTRTRVSLIKLLSDYRDARAVPAFSAALRDFARNPSESKDDADIKWAARAYQHLGSAELAGPMFDAFEKLQAHTALGAVSYKAFAEALSAHPSPAWLPRLIPKLSAAVPPLPVAAVDEYRDQIFLQSVSAQLLGILGDARAVNPLLRVVLDPAKRHVHETAAFSLVQLGEPAEHGAIRLLRGEGELGRDIASAAWLLGKMGRKRTLAAFLEALHDVQEPALRAVLARELLHIPPSAEALSAFKQVFETTPATTVLASGEPALVALAEAAANTFDPSLVDWLLERAARATGGREQRKALQISLVISALKLATLDQLPQLKVAVNTYGTQLERKAFAYAENVTRACGADARCYLSEVTKPENQDHERQFGGLKAATMFGVFGNAEGRDSLLDEVGSIENAAVMLVLARAIDHLTPDGSKEVAERLAAIVEHGEQSADRARAATQHPLKDVMIRVQTR